MSKACTIQDVFNRFYPAYAVKHMVPEAHRKTAWHIMNCKTGALGVNISVCEECGCISVHNNSCRDRCCPMCQQFAKEKWVDARREDVLDAPYFHVVFTVPEELNPVIYSNQKLLWSSGSLEFNGTAEKFRNHYEFRELLNTCYAKEWVPYCKKPFRNAESVIKYLGKYTHRIAISNGRIKSMTDATVTFSVKDYKKRGQWKDLTLPGEEFIRRFLMHVPPKRFVRIRHYGLLSSRNKSSRIPACRNILGLQNCWKFTFNNKRKYCLLPQTCNKTIDKSKER